MSGTRNTSRAYFKYIGQNARIITKERRRAQMQEARKGYRTRDRDERNRAAVEIAEYLHRVPTSPVF